MERGGRGPALRVAEGVVVPAAGRHRQRLPEELRLGREAGGGLAEEMLRRQRAGERVAAPQGGGQVAQAHADLRRHEGLQHDGMLTEPGALFAGQGEFERVGARRQVVGEGHLRRGGAARVGHHREGREAAAVGLQDPEHGGEGGGRAAVGLPQQGLHEGLLAVAVEVALREEVGLARCGGEIAARGRLGRFDFRGVGQRQEGHVAVRGILRHEQERLVARGIEPQPPQARLVRHHRVEERVIATVERDLAAGRGAAGAQGGGPDLQGLRLPARGEADVREADEALPGRGFFRLEPQQEDALRTFRREVVAQTQGETLLPVADGGQPVGAQDRGAGQIPGGVALASLAVGVPVGILLRLAHGELHEVLRQDRGQRADDHGRVHRQHGDDQRALGGQVAPGNGDLRGRRARSDEHRAAHFMFEGVPFRRAQPRGDDDCVGLADGKLAAQGEAAPPPMLARDDGEGRGRLAGDAAGGQLQVDILCELEIDFGLTEARRDGAGLGEAEDRGHRQQRVGSRRRRRVACVGGTDARLEDRAEAVAAHGRQRLNLAGVALRRVDELPRHGGLAVVQRQPGAERGPLHGSLELAGERQEPVGREGGLRQTLEDERHGGGCRGGGGIILDVRCFGRALRFRGAKPRVPHPDPARGIEHQERQGEERQTETPESGKVHGGYPWMMKRIIARFSRGSRPFRTDGVESRPFLPAAPGGALARLGTDPAHLLPVAPRAGALAQPLPLRHAARQCRYRLVRAGGPRCRTVAARLPRPDLLGLEQRHAAPLPDAH